MLAVGDEDGFVSCVNTDRPLPHTLHAPLADHPLRAQWPAHDNAIFDLCWMQVRLAFPVSKHGCLNVHHNVSSVAAGLLSPDLWVPPHWASP